MHTHKPAHACAQRHTHACMFAHTHTHTHTLVGWDVSDCQFPLLLFVSQMDVYDVAMRYQSEGRSVIILAGKEYGSGSSRDWAAKGPWILVSGGPRRGEGGTESVCLRECVLCV